MAVWYLAGAWLFGVLVQRPHRANMGRDATYTALSSVFLSPLLTWMYLAAVAPMPRCSSCQRWFLGA